MIALTCQFRQQAIFLLYIVTQHDSINIKLESITDEFLMMLPKKVERKSRLVCLDTKVNL